MYRLSFGLKLKSKAEDGRKGWEVEPKVWFCFERDVLCIDTECWRPCEGVEGVEW